MSQSQPTPSSSPAIAAPTAHRLQQQQILQALHRADKQIKALQQAPTEPIAVIGMGCRLPGGAHNPAAYWELLQQGRDAIVPVPPSRWPIAPYYDADPEVPGRMYTRSGGFLQTPIEDFDAQFFGISPREAIKLDPQQRLLLEVTWEAIEQAGLTRPQLRGSQTGVFVGVSTHDYEYQIYSEDLSQVDVYGGLGNSISITAGRIAYFLGLQGPTFQMDTACSSSLVAAHLACQSLRSRESHLAIVGGVNITLSPLPTIFFCKTQALSPDGRCKAFDASADGYGRGEGCGIVILKRMSDAVADGDNILGLIRGSAINHDGASSGLTVPNKRAQQQLLRQALANARVQPDAIDYVEAHGTGTRLGDPIEVEALNSVLGAGRSAQNPLILGSAKTNIGHLEAAAGVAGLIKVILALQHREIPPHLHFKTPTPQVNWAALPIKIPTQCQPWPHQDGKPPLAGLSSFGFSGTNVHLVLEGFAPAPPPAVPETSGQAPDSPHVVTLSAKTAQALAAQVSQYVQYLATHTLEQGSSQDWLKTPLNLSNIAYTTTLGRTHFKHRVALVVTSVAQLQTQLDQLRQHWAALPNLPQAGDSATQPSATGAAIPSRFLGQARRKRPTLAFALSDRGIQDLTPLAALYATETAFRNAIDQADAIVTSIWGHSIGALFTEASAASRQSPPIPVGVFTLVVEVALARLWQHWGIDPDVLLAQGWGEYGAACVAGIFSFETGLRLLLAPDRAAMVTTLTLAPAQVPIRQTQTGIDLTTAMEQPQYWLAEHRSQPQPPTPQASTSQASQLPNGTLANPTHSTWDIGLELGLATPLPPNSDLWLEGMTADRPLKAQLLEHLAQLYVRGMAIDWLAFWGQTRSVPVSQNRARHHGPQNHPPRKVQLPTYPFQRQRYWLESDVHQRFQAENSALETPTTTQPGSGASARSGRNLPSPITPAIHHPLLGRRVHLAGATHSTAIRFEAEVCYDHPRYVQYHRVYGEAIVPAASFFELALAAGREIYEVTTLALADVLVQQPLVLPPEQWKVLQTVLTPIDSTTAAFQIFSLAPVAGQAVPEETLHVTGQISRVTESANPPDIDIATVQSRLPVEHAPAQFYQQLADLGIDIDPPLHTLQAIRYGGASEPEQNEAETADAEALFAYHLSTEWGQETFAYMLHPVLLDACVQVGGFSCALFQAVSQEVHLPFGVERLRFYRSPVGDRCWCYSRPPQNQDPKSSSNPSSNPGQTLRIDLHLIDTQGTVFASLEGLLVRPAPPSIFRDRQWKTVSQWLYQVNWQMQPRFGYPLPNTFLPSPQALSQQLAPAMTHHQVQATLAFYPELIQHLESLSLDYIAQALLHLGWAFPPGEPKTTATLMQQLGVIPQHQRLFQRLLQILAEEQLLPVVNGTEPHEPTLWQGGQQLNATLAERDKGIPAKVQQLHDRYPAAASELQLLETCGQQLAAVLRGSVDPLHLIFPEGDATIVNRLYGATPAAQALNTWIQQTVALALETLPRDRGVRLLEIGAGTGGTTQQILPHLDRDRTEYVFTDLGAIFLTQAKAKFQDYAFIRYDTLDIEQAPTQQGFTSHAFDIVIAANVLHATTSLAQTLTHIQQLLAPGGWLVILEGTRPQRWMDLTFGLLEGWWKFQDVDCRPHYPLASPATWRTVLAKTGFQAIQILPEDLASATSMASQTVPQNLIVAQANSGPLQLAPPPVPVPQSAPLGIADLAQPSSLPRSWLILGDRTGLTPHLVSLIEATADHCVVVTPDSLPIEAATWVEHLHPLMATTNLAGIIHCWGLNTTVNTPTLQPFNPELDGNDVQPTLEVLETAQQLGCQAVLFLLQALQQLPSPIASTSSPQRPSLWLVTQGAQTVIPDHPQVTDIRQASLWGLGKVIALEYPELNCRRLDLDPGLSLQTQAQAQIQAQTLWDEIQAGCAIGSDRIHLEDQVALRAGQRYVARLERSALAQTPMQPKLKLTHPGTYLITGGLGGLGLWVARWLVQAGVRHLVLVGRRGVQSEHQTQVTELEAAGAKVWVAPADVSCRSAIAAVIEAIDQDFPPLKGVIHAAGVLADGFLHQQTWERFAQVLAPKVQGAWNLHQLTLHHNLDHFILFSSAASLLGSPGQGNHAAANAFLDALAHYRHQMHRPGLSLNWGAISQIGSAASRQADHYFQRWGLEAITPDHCLTFLNQVMQTPIPQVGIVPMQGSSLLQQELALPFYQNFWITPVTESAESSSTILSTLQAITPAQRKAILTEHIQSQVAQVLVMSSPKDVALEQGFFELGMDSLTSIELRNRLQQSLNCVLPATAAFDYPTVGELVDYLAEKVLSTLENKVPEEGVSMESSESLPPLSPEYNLPTLETNDSGDWADPMTLNLDHLSTSKLAELLHQEIVDNEVLRTELTS